MRSPIHLALTIGLGLAILSGLSAPATDPPGATDIRKLIDQLGSSSYSEREGATRVLEAAGEAALPGLRKAAGSDDAEVRRRAEDLLRKIEQRVETAHLLAPTKVKLDFKDTPLPQAVESLSKQGVCSLVLHDPKGQLKERKITLTTEEIGFWEALDLLCSKGQISEEGTSPPGLTVASSGGTAPLPPAGGFVAPPAGPISVFPNPMVALGQITLVDSKPAALPTAYAGAIRIRCQRTAASNGDPGHVSLDLVVTGEPRIRWQDSFSLRILKVVDDQGQELSLADDAIMPTAPPWLRQRYSPYTAGFPLQYLQMRLVAGEKAAKALREVRGALSGRLYTEPRPTCIVDDVLNSAGKKFAGAEGGSIKVLEANRTNPERLTLRFQFEPASDAGIGRGRFVPPGGAAPVAVAGGAPAAPAGGAIRRVGGFSLLDTKGRSLPAAGFIRHDRMAPIREITMEFEIPKGRQPDKFIYAATKAVAVDVPFTLKDVPLH